VTSEEPWYALERLRTLFGLSAFERDLLVLCAGQSLESRFAVGCASAQGDPRGTWPTFGLALTILDDPHWSAVSAGGPLRYWHLVDLEQGNLLHAPLHLDERILAFLLGVPAVDERLAALVRPIPAEPAPPDADAWAGAGADSPQQAVVRAGARHWARAAAPREPLLLIGRHRSVRQAAFVGICQRSGLAPYILDANDIPAAPAEREHLARLWTREAALTGAALCVPTEDCGSVRHVSAWLEATQAPVAVEVRPGTTAEQLDGLRRDVLRRQLHPPPQARRVQAELRPQAQRPDLQPPGRAVPSVLRGRS